MYGTLCRPVDGLEQYFVRVQNKPEIGMHYLKKALFNFIRS